MKAYLSLIVVILLMVPAGLTSVADPTLTISSPDENDIINSNVFNVTGTAAGSTGTILQTTELQLQQGSHDNSTTTSTGEVIIFMMPALIKENNGDPVLSNETTGKFDFKGVSTPSVILKGGTYHMWYTGNDKFNDRIGYATSPDGIAWTRQNGGNPVLDLGAMGDFDSFGVNDPWVFDDAGVYHMWYTGSDGLKTKIGHATSNNGILWTKDGVSLDLGDFGTFDADGTSSPTVVKVGGTFHMWYVGVTGTAKAIGYATSNDGSSWARKNNGNYVLDATGLGTFDGITVSGPSVTLFNGVYKLYYTGYSGNNNQIGVATSADGIHWIRRNGGNPVLSPTNFKFDWKNVANPTVLWDGLTERMWYVGTNATTNQLGYATGAITDIKGTYTSPPFDLSGNVDFQKINWTTDTPAGTAVTVVVRTQPKSNPWGAWFTPTNGVELNSANGSKFQYMVNLSSDDISKTPMFKDLTLQYYSPVVKVEASTTGSVWYPCTGTTSWSCSVQGLNGKVLVRARSIDSTGAHSDVLFRNVTLNGDAPSGYVKINDGAKVTTTRNVGLKFNATDSAGVVSMMMSEDFNFTGATWENFQETKAYTLSQEDGYKNIYVKYKDTYGMISQRFNASILLDTTPPNGTIVINEGKQFTTKREVILSLSASDRNGVTGAMWSEDQTFKGLQPGVFSANEFFTLTQGDATKTVYVRFFDEPGNFADYSASIILDTAPPTGSVKINSNAAVTITRMVNLTIDGNDKNGVKEMMLSNLPGLNGSAWEPYAESKLWNLTKGEGSKVVYIRFKDTAGLESAVIQDTVEYNPPPNEDIIKINNGTKYTSDRNVTLDIELGGPGDVAQMMISNEPTFKNLSWQPYENKIAWELAPVDSVKFVYVKFLTPSGIETDYFFANITLDTTPPVVLIKTPANATVYKVKTADLRIKATDGRGIEKVEVSMDDGPWQLTTVNKTDSTTYDYAMKWTVKGTHTFKVRATDFAGNSAETQISVIYKPAKKKKSPFLDTTLMMTALAVALVIVAARTRRTGMN